MKVYGTKKKINIFGFTLVELLVVITIIGILATSWVAVFTKQLQWARDTTRINDVKLIQTSLHQYFADNDEYPVATSFSGSIDQYMSKKLKDPKKAKALCWFNDGSTAESNGLCAWYYAVTEDEFGLEKASFKIWVFFEKEENYEQIAHSTGKKTDGWVYDSIYEVFAWQWSSDDIMVIAKDWTYTESASLSRVY